MQWANLTLQGLAQTLRRKVYELAQSVSHQQWPAYYDGLLDEFCLVRCGEASEGASPPRVGVNAQDGPPKLEAELNLRQEVRRVVQQALTDLGFDTGGPMASGANTRRATSCGRADRLASEPHGRSWW